MPAVGLVCGGWVYLFFHVQLVFVVIFMFYGPEYDFKLLSMSCTTTVCLLFSFLEVDQGGGWIAPQFVRCCWLLCRVF